MQSLDWNDKIAENCGIRKTSTRSSGMDREPRNVLYRIKRGLAGFVSYLAACEMNQAFSEYVLYEPILRILTARGPAACPFRLLANSLKLFTVNGTPV